MMRDSNFVKHYSDLAKRILITLLLLLCYRIGSFIPLPMLQVSKIPEIFDYTSKGILGMFNMLSGGSLSRLSIFTLSIVPYVTASIVMQLLIPTIPYLKNLRSEGHSGQVQIYQYTKYLTILVAFFQALAVAKSIQSAGLFMDINIGFISPIFIVCLTLITGVILLLWLGKQITSFGIGNGISLIIFTGIVAEIPKVFLSFFELLKSGALNPVYFLFILATFVATIVFIIFIERSYRIVPVVSSRQNMARFDLKQQQKQNSIPLKINSAGVIPPIFASSLLLFPLTISTLFQSSSNPVLQWLSLNLTHGKPLFVIIYIVLIVFFTFFYTGIAFDTKEVSESLKKGGTLIQGVRPGVATQNYLSSILNHLSCLAAVYLCIICTMPELFSSVNNLAVMLGGTSLLIVVNVSTDTVTQIRLAMLPSKYEKLMTKRK